MQSAVRFGLAALLTLPAIGCAQEKRVQNDGSLDHRKAAQEKDEPKAPEQPRRLETVTWNSVKHELTWVISSGDRAKKGDGGGLFQPEHSANYQISLDEATMSFEGETRRFSREEASNVHVLMDLIAKYAVDSTVWWEDGQGEPLDPKKPNQERTPAKPEKLNNDDESVATLRVAAPVMSSSDLPALRLQIHRLEQRLADLKRLERSARQTVMAKD